MTQLLQHRKIDNQIADRDADTRVAVPWLKNAEWQVLQWEMRIRWDLDERFERHKWQGRFDLNRPKRLCLKEPGRSW